MYQNRIYASHLLTEDCKFPKKHLQLFCGSTYDITSMICGLRNGIVKLLNNVNLNNCDNYQVTINFDSCGCDDVFDLVADIDVSIEKTKLDYYKPKIYKLSYAAPNEKIRSINDYNPEYSRVFRLELRYNTYHANGNKITPLIGTYFIIYETKKDIIDKYDKHSIGFYSKHDDCLSNYSIVYDGRTSLVFNKQKDFRTEFDVIFTYKDKLELTQELKKLLKIFNDAKKLRGTLAHTLPRYTSDDGKLICDISNKQIVVSDKNNSIILDIMNDKFMDIMEKIFATVELAIADDISSEESSVNYKKIVRNGITYYKDICDVIDDNDNKYVNHYCVGFNKNTSTFIIGTCDLENCHYIDFRSIDYFKEFVDNFIQYCNDRRYGNHNFNNVLIDYRYTLPKGNSIALTRLNPADNTHYMIYYFDSMYNDVKNTDMYLPNEMLDKIFLDIRKDF